MKKLLQKNNKGFTLIEAAITISVLSIIGYNVLPKILEIQEFNESLFYKKIFSSLIYTQNLAIYSGCHIGVIPYKNSLHIITRTNCRQGNFETIVQDPNNLPNAYIINTPINIKLNYSNFPLYFDNNGQIKSLVHNNIINAKITIEGIKIAKIIDLNGNNGLID